VTALHAEPAPNTSTAKSRQRKVDAEGCCAPCRRRARRRAAPRRQKDPEELSSFIAHVIRLVRRDAAAVAEPSEVLPHLVALGRVVDDEMRAAVRVLRSEPYGYSWELIADQLGISKQAAQKRFGALMPDQPNPAPASREPQRPVDDNHALRIGWVAGVLMHAAELEPLTGINTRGVEILDDGAGNHLDTIRLYARSGTFLVAVTREATS
jgi:hypothetical protein